MHYAMLKVVCVIIAANSGIAPTVESTPKRELRLAHKKFGIRKQHDDRSQMQRRNKTFSAGREKILLLLVVAAILDAKRKEDEDRFYRFLYAAIPEPESHALPAAPARCHQTLQIFPANSDWPDRPNVASDPSVAFFPVALNQWRVVHPFERASIHFRKRTRSGYTRSFKLPSAAGSPSRLLTSSIALLLPA